MTTVAVVGATGRLGAQVVRVVDGMDGFELIAQLNSRSELAEIDGADIVVDVTRHDVSERVIDRAVANGQRILVGTSGWSSARIEAKRFAAADTVVVIPNFSIGSTVATHVSGVIAKYLPHAHIGETHHINKVDAPSGTSIRTAEVIAANRPAGWVAPAGHPDALPDDHIVDGVPITSHRFPDVIAKQVVAFEGNGETIRLEHETTSRDSYDEGIAAAIRFTATASGLTVGLDQVLGIR
jgi:4-hydroxy-tetrahydrodipicolinate reductase